MNKKELTNKVATQIGLTTVVASRTIDAVFKTIKEGLEHGNSTTIMGFGCFSVGSRAERKGVNPSTKESITIPAHKVVKFSSSKT
ncbi:MAG: HU family DNA-binding protein, partial [Rikenellaceae bacterium]